MPLDPNAADAGTTPEVKVSPRRPAPAPVPVPAGEAPAPPASYFNYFLRQKDAFANKMGGVDYNGLNAQLADAFNDGTPVTMGKDEDLLKEMQSVYKAENKPFDKAAEVDARNLIKAANEGYQRYAKLAFNSYNLRGGPLPDTNENILKGLPVTRRLQDKSADLLLPGYKIRPGQMTFTGLSEREQSRLRQDEADHAEDLYVRPDTETNTLRDQYKKHRMVAVDSGQLDEKGNPIPVRTEDGEVMMRYEAGLRTDVGYGRTYDNDGNPIFMELAKGTDLRRTRSKLENVTGLEQTPEQVTLLSALSASAAALTNTATAGYSSSVWKANDEWAQRTGLLGAGMEQLEAWAGYEPGRVNFQSQLGGTGSAIAGAGRNLDAGYHKLKSGLSDVFVGVDNVLPGGQGSARQEYHRDEANREYLKSANLLATGNSDTQGTFYKSLPAFTNFVGEQAAQQMVQQSLNFGGALVGMPGLGMAWMSTTAAESTYTMAGQAGLKRGPAVALGALVGALTYGTEKFIDPNIAGKLGTRLAGKLSGELVEVIQKEQGALLSAVTAKLRAEGIRDLSTVTEAQVLDAAKGLTPAWLRKLGRGMADLNESYAKNIKGPLERTTLGGMALQAHGEGIEELVENPLNAGINSIGRHWLEDEDGNPRPAWVKGSLADGSNPLAEKSWQDIYKESWEGYLGGALAGGVMVAPYARQNAKDLRAQQAAEKNEKQNQAIAKYLVDHQFAPAKVAELKKELEKFRDKGRLGTMLKPDGTKADNVQDTENEVVFQALSNKLDVLARLGTDAGLTQKLTPALRPRLVTALAELGNENVRTTQALDVLYRYHEKQQDLQRLLSGHAPVVRDPLTGAPVRPDLSDPNNPTGPNQNLGAVLPGFDPSQGSLGMSQADYEVQRTLRRAQLKSQMLTAGQSDADAETALAKGIDEERQRATGSGALAVITRSREVGAWYENQALIQKLNQQLIDTDASDFEKRKDLREQIAEAQLESEPLEQALSLATGQDTSGVLSRVKAIADAQLELNDLKGANADVFNGNLLKTHLQEGYVLHLRKRLVNALAQARTENNPLLVQRLEAELNVLEQEFFVDGQVDATRLGLRNGQRKEFIAAQLAQQTAVNTASSAAAQAAQVPLDALVQAVAPDPTNPVSVGDTLLNHIDKAEALAAALTAAGGVSASQRKDVTDLAVRATSQSTQARQLIDNARQARRQQIRDEVIQEGMFAIYGDQAGIDAADPQDVMDMHDQFDSDGATDAETDTRLAAEPADPALGSVERLEKAAQELSAQKPSGALLDQDADYFDVSFGTGTSGFNPLKNNAPVNAINEQIAKALDVLYDYDKTTGIYTEKTDKSALAEAIANNLNLGQLEAARDEVLSNIGHLGINTGIHNRLLQPDVLPTTANMKDYLTQNEATAERILKTSLRQLQELNHAIAAVKNSGDRYAVDDKLRGQYLDRSGEQLRTRVLGAAATQAAAALTPAAQAAYDAAKQALDDLDALNLDPNGQDRKTLQDNLQAGVELLTKAEQSLRQVFVDDAQRAALYSELLTKAGTEVLGAAATTASPEQLLVAGQRALLSTEDQNIEPYAGTGLLLQNLFSVDRGQFAAAYLAQTSSQVSPAGTAGQVNPLASLEQEQVVYDIVSAGLSSVASQTGYGTLDGVYAKQTGQKDIKIDNGQNGFLARFTLYITGFAGAGKTFMVAGNGIATLAHLLGKDNAGNKLRVMSSAPHIKQQANLRDSLQSASDLLAVESAELAIILSALQNDSLAADVLVVDEATILSDEYANNLIVEVEAFNQRRLVANPGAAPLRLLLLGDPAQLSGPQTNGNRDRSHLFTKSGDLIKPTARPLTQVYRTGLQTLFNGQDVYRNRILSTSPGVNRDTSPIDDLSWNQAGADLTTLEGVQYLSETTQREQIRDHIAAVEAWNIANPTEPARTLAVIVSPGDVAEEIRALTAMGVAGAAEYVTDSQKTGTLSVDKAQGQSFTYVYASINERDAYVAGGLMGNQLNRPDSTLRALNVALSRAQHYASIRLQQGQTMPNNPKDTQAGFTDETPAARTTRNQGKLDSLAALAKLADTTGTTGGAQAPAGTTTGSTGNPTTGSNAGAGPNTSQVVANELIDMEQHLDWALTSSQLTSDAARIDRLENHLMPDVLTLQQDAANQTSQEQLDIEAFRQKVIAAIGTLQGQTAASGTQGGTQSGATSGATPSATSGATVNAGPVAGPAAGAPPVSGPIVLPAVTVLVDMVETLTGTGVATAPGTGNGSDAVTDPLDAAAATPSEPDGFLFAPANASTGTSLIGQLTDEAQQQLTDLGQALLAARGAFNTWLTANPQADAAAVGLVTAQLDQAEAHYAYFAAQQQAAMDAALTLPPDVDGQNLQPGEATPQQAGLFVVLDANGLPESAVYQHPVMDEVTGKTTYQPLSQTFTGSPMQRLNQLQAWARKQTKELRAAQIAIDNNSVSKLAIETKGILHLHVQRSLGEALAAQQVRERKTKSGALANLFNRVLNRVRQQIDNDTSEGLTWRGTTGQLLNSDFQNLERRDGSGVFKGDGSFRIRYEDTVFNHALATDDTSNPVFNQQLFLVEYVEDGHTLTVGALRKTPDAASASVRGTTQGELPLDAALRHVATQPNGLNMGTSLSLESVKPARYQPFTDLAEAQSLGAFRAQMAEKGVAVSQPYVVTVRADDAKNQSAAQQNVLTASGFAFHAAGHVDPNDTRRGFSGRAVVFTAFTVGANPLTQQEQDAVSKQVNDAMALGQSKGWNPQQVADYLYFNHELEMVVLENKAATLDDYLNGLFAAADGKGGGRVATSAQLEGELVTRLDARGNLDFRKNDATRQAAWTTARKQLKKMLFGAYQARGTVDASKKNPQKNKIRGLVSKLLNVYTAYQSAGAGAGRALFTAVPVPANALPVSGQPIAYQLNPALAAELNAVFSAEQQKHLTHILNLHVQQDNERFNAGAVIDPATGKIIPRGYDARYAEDLIYYLGYLNQQPGFKGQLGQAWDDDTSNTKHYEGGYGNQVQVNPVVDALAPGEKRGVFTPMSQVAGLDPEQVLQTKRTEKSIPSVVINLQSVSAEATKGSSQQSSTSSNANGANNANAPAGAASSGFRPGRRNLNTGGVTVGTATPAEAFARAVLVFGDGIKVKLNEFADFATELGSMVQGVLHYNQAANGLIDRDTVDHEIVHRLMRVIDPKMRAKVYAQTRQLMQQQGVPGAETATIKEVDEWLAVHGGTHLRDFEQSGATFKARTAALKKNFPALHDFFMWLRDAYRNILKHPDYIGFVFQDAMAGRYMGASYRAAEYEFDDDRLLSRNVQSQRLADWLTLEQAFGGRERLQILTEDVASDIYRHHYGYAPGKEYKNITAAIQDVRAAYADDAAYGAAQGMPAQMSADQDRDTSYYAKMQQLMQPWALPAADETVDEDEREARKNLLPFDIIVRHALSFVSTRAASAQVGEALNGGGPVVEDTAGDNADPNEGNAQVAGSESDDSGENSERGFGENGPSSAQAIGRTTEYIADKNREATMSEVLKFHLENVPHYERDAASGQYRKSSRYFKSDSRRVKDVFVEADKLARERAAKRGDTRITIEDLMLGVARVMNKSTSDTRDVAASVFAHFFNHTTDGLRDQKTGQEYTGRRVETYDNQEGAWVSTEADTYSLYEVGYPDHDLGRVDTSGEALPFVIESQRLLTQLLTHVNNIETRSFMNIDMNRPAPSTSDKKVAANAIKNLNQSTLVGRFFTKQGDTYVPNPVVLQSLIDKGFTVVTDPAKNDEALLRFRGQDFVRMSFGWSGKGDQAFVVHGGSAVKGLSPKLLEDGLFEIFRLSGMSVPRKLLAQLLDNEGRTAITQQTGFRGFAGFGPGLVSKLVGQAIGAHVRHGGQEALLTQLGVDAANPRHFWANPLLNSTTDDILVPLGLKNKKQSQLAYSPTYYRTAVQELADYQNELVQARRPRFEYSPDNEKIFRDQLQNAGYQRLAELKLEARDAAGEAKDGRGHSTWSAPRGRLFRPALISPFDSSIGHRNRVAAGDWTLDLHVFNALTNEAKNKKKAVVGASPAELHRTAIDKLFGGALQKPTGEETGETGKSSAVNIDFMAAAVSDKGTQYDLQVGHGEWQKGIFGLSSPLIRQELRNIKRGYDALFAEDVAGRLATALEEGFNRQITTPEFAALPSEARVEALRKHEQTQSVLEQLRRNGNIPRLLRFYNLQLSAKPYLTQGSTGLVRGIDYDGNGAQLSARLSDILTMSDNDFIDGITTGNREEALQIARDGYRSIPTELVDELAKRGLLGANWDVQEDNAFIGKSNSDGSKSRYHKASIAVRDAKGDIIGERPHPALLVFAQTNLVHQWHIDNALLNNELYFKSEADKVKRGILNATNYEALDTTTSRGVGKRGQLNLVRDRTWAELHVINAEGNRDLYFSEDPVTGEKTYHRTARDADNAFQILEAMQTEGLGFDVADLKKKGFLLDGWGAINPLQWLLQNESLGNKYSDRSQRKTGIFDARSEDGAPILGKASFGIMGNSYLRLANQHAYHMMAQSLGGYESPLYKAWQAIRNAPNPKTGEAWTPQELDNDDDWRALHEHFILSENRRELEPHLKGTTLMDSGMKIAVRRLNSVTDEVFASLGFNNSKTGPIVNLNQDTKKADIANITQENHIIAVLGNNFRTSVQVYELLRVLAYDGSLELEGLIKKAGSKEHFMGQLERMLQNLNNTGNTLDMARARMSPNLPLLDAQLRNAIASSLKQYSTRQRFSGLRATVQSSTGMVNMYNVVSARDKDGNPTASTRYTKEDLLKRGLATPNDKGQLVFAEGSDIETDELHFMRLYEKNADGTRGALLNPEKTRAFVKARMRYEKHPHLSLGYNTTASTDTETNSQRDIDHQTKWGKRKDVERATGRQQESTYVSLVNGKYVDAGQNHDTGKSTYQVIRYADDSVEVLRMSHFSHTPSGQFNPENTAGSAESFEQQRQQIVEASGFNQAYDWSDAALKAQRDAELANPTMLQAADKHWFDMTAKEYVDHMLPQLHLEPMEVMIPRDFVKEFGIDAKDNVTDVNEAGADYFVQQQQRAAQALAGADVALTSEQVQAATDKGNKLWQNWQDMLQVKATRIPVTNLNSLQMCKVVAFFDGQSNTALVPSEMLIVAGADNDGDMLTLEFLQLTRDGMVPQHGTNPDGTVKYSPQAARYEMFKLKQGVLTDPFNVDQLFKPIDFSDLDPAVAEFKGRTGKASDDGVGGGSEDTKKYGPLKGFYRHSHNIALWTANQAGKSGVGPIVKGREIFDAAYTVQRAYGESNAQNNLTTFGQPVYFLGQRINQLTEAARPVTYMFEGTSNASLDNAKDPKLGYLNINQETWGAYTAAFMTLQDHTLVNTLLNHPYTRRAVQRVQRANNINATFRKNLLTELRKQLTNEADNFDSSGQFEENELHPYMSWGLGYTQPNVDDQVAAQAQAQALITPGDEAAQVPDQNTLKSQSLFERVQAEQERLYNLHQQGNSAYPNLDPAHLNENLTPEQEVEIQKYVIENLFLLVSRAEELMDAQGVLNILGGVEGQEQDNRRQFKNLLSGLGYGSLPMTQALEKLRALTSEDPAVRAQEIQRKKFLTLNTRALFETNGFLRAAALAMVRDAEVRRELFIDRSPQVKGAFAALEAQNPGFYRQLAGQKLRAREFGRWVDAQFLSTARYSWLGLSAAEQATHPLLPALAKHDLGTVAGRAAFTRNAAEYLQQVKMDDASARQYPVSESELLAHLQSSAHEKYNGTYIELTNGINLDPQDKRLLATHFHELPTKYGASGSALQQVLATYSLLHHGLNLGRGSFAEVLSPESVRGYSDFRDEYHAALNAQADAMTARVKRGDEPVQNPALSAQLEALAAFTDEFQAYNPQTTREWKQAAYVSDADAEFLDSASDEMLANYKPKPRKGTFYMKVEDMPERLSVDELRAGTTGLKKRTDAELPRYIHLPNKLLGPVLFQRDDQTASGTPVWRRQYPSAHAQLNRYGEHAFSNGPVFANDQNLAGETLRENPAYQVFQVRARAHAERNGLLKTDPDTKEKSYDVTLSGNQEMVVREDKECI